MRNLYIRVISGCFCIYTKSMILCSDLAFTRNQIFNRMVQTSVAMMHFKGRDTISQRQQLLSETNSKKWFLRLKNLFYRVNGVLHWLRITWAIADKIAIGTEFLQLFK